MLGFLEEVSIAAGSALLEIPPWHLPPVRAYCYFNWLGGPSDQCADTLVGRFEGNEVAQSNDNCS